ncbi:PTS glucose transporter subunit IIA [Nocardiopsis sp. CNR-923]|uniref:PTS sugar transporter subunit IIA n=1 Tax=Nocardiopsis sp. CNR-923 TaxID=1904965 RepID=UPI000964EED1|nr:PTS glucose transporter subunit IIA [Nocardiopsis sp. CNR-923]OLT28194.1 PTS glucose transporter subunit IIA [Nocardiopsis sp. CNR-923]
MSDHALRVLSPVPGTARPLDSVPDPVFSRSMVGPGVAVHPETGTEGADDPQEACSPIDGTVVKLHPHAYVVTSPDGARSVLVHLGIDTVELAGEGFALLVDQGAEVRAGTPVVRWRPGRVAALGKSPAVPVVALDAAPAALAAPADGAVGHGDPLFTWG